MPNEAVVIELLQQRVETLLGARVNSWQRVEGGYTPALRLVCRTDRGSFFVKAGATPLTSEFVRREISVYRRLRGPFMPELVAWKDDAGTPVLVLEDLSAHHWPPPWDERLIDRVLAQAEVMHAERPDLEPFAEVHGGRQEGWATVAADPEPFLSLGVVDAVWLEGALPALIEAEGRCTTEGDALCHCDLRSDNLCVAGDRAIFVDWNAACLSNPRLDLGFWLPSLQNEGGPPPDIILPDAPEVAAWVSGFFAARAGLPQVPDAPRVRWVQQRQLTTALPWAARALDLAPAE